MPCHLNALPIRIMVSNLKNNTRCEDSGTAIPAILYSLSDRRNPTVSADAATITVAVPSMRAKPPA